MAFEVERTKDGYKVRRGSKGPFTTLTKKEGAELKTISLRTLRILRVESDEKNPPDAMEFYQAIAHLDMHPKVIKVRCVNGWITETQREPAELKLPPEEDAEAEE